MGIMGYRTPNIDRIGKEGAVFTDWYGQQSCTAGRAAFITGQSPIRTGLTKVGLPGAKLGLGPEDPTVADVPKSLGYATGGVDQAWETTSSREWKSDESCTSKPEIRNCELDCSVFMQVVQSQISEFGL